MFFFSVLKFGAEDRYYHYAMINLLEYRFCQNTVFKTISELLKKDAGLRVKKKTLRLLYLVVNCKFSPITNSSIFFFIECYIIWCLSPVISIVFAITIYVILTSYLIYVFSHDFVVMTLNENNLLKKYHLLFVESRPWQHENNKKQTSTIWAMGEIISYCPFWLFLTSHIKNMWICQWISSVLHVIHLQITTNNE